MTDQAEEKEVAEEKPELISDNVIEIGKVEEKKEEEVEEESEDDEDEDDIHPIEVLGQALEDIESQLDRIRKKNRNPTNLRKELAHNIYPVLLKGFSAVYEWMAGEVEQEQEEQEQMFEQAYREAIEKTMNTCEKIASLKERVGNMLSDNTEEGGSKDMDNWNDICVFAEKYISEAKTIQAQE